MTPNPELTIVSPCFNEEENIPQLHAELTRVCKGMGISYEILLVENGSLDRSFEIMRSYAKDDPHLRIVRLSRNFTYQGGITAGMTHASGNYLVCIDADLQDPVDLIPALYAKAADEGFDIVYGVRRSRREGLFLRLSYRVFYRLMQKMTPFDVPLDAGDFAIINRQVLDALLALPEKDRFLRGLRAWVGFNSTGIPYDRGARERGESKFSSSALFLIAFQGLFSFSFKPLRILFYFGIVCLLAVFPLIAGYVVWRIMDPTAWPPGTATIIILLFAQIGLMMAGMGLLGQYIAIVFSEVKSRPTFIASELVNFSDAPPDADAAPPTNVARSR